MSIISICNEALAKNHEMAAIPDDADLDAPVGKNQTIAARFYPGARRAALRLAEWTCILARLPLARERWEAEAEWEAGDRIVAGLEVFECTTAGTSGSDEPTWPATWTAVIAITEAQVGDTGPSGVQVVSLAPNTEASPGDLAIAAEGATAGTVVDGTVTWTYRHNAMAALPEQNSTGLAYAYALPADYILKKAAITPSGEKIHAEIERGILYADAPEVVLVYVPDETDDTLYDPLLREVVVAQVASAFAYPLTGKHDNEVAYAQAAMSLAAAATVRTKQEHRDGPPASEPWADGLFEERSHP